MSDNKKWITPSGHGNSTIQQLLMGRSEGSVNTTVSKEMEDKMVLVENLTHSHLCNILTFEVDTTDMDKGQVCGRNSCY